MIVVTSHPGPKGRARRAEIVRVATETLASGGLDGFVLREVAARAGMTLGNLQYYFPSRDDLLEAVVRDEFERNLEAVRVSTDGGWAGLADELLAQWAAPGGLVFTTLALLARQERPGGRFAAIHQEVYRTFYAELVAALRRQGTDAPDDDLLVRARAITALLDGLSVQGYGAEPGRTELQERRTRAAIAVLIAAVASGGVAGLS